MQKKDLISITDFSKAEYLRIMELAADFEQNPNRDLLRGKVVATLFYEPSTRTRLSFETAINRLGGRIIGFSDSSSSSVSKGETLHDTIRMVSNYADLIVMRHPLEGSARYASEVSSVPVINAGDGWGEHPTQVLTDLYTVLNEMGTIDGLTFLCIGDMRMRTMHSISYALTQFDAQVIYVAPPEMSLTDDFKKELDMYNLRYTEADHVADVIDKADVIYMEPVVQPDYTKARQEASADKGLTPSNYQVTRKLLGEKAKSDAIILHSLPRMDELPSDVDSTRHARYWEEAFNGVVMRMALLALVLGAME